MKQKYDLQNHLRLLSKDYLGELMIHNLILEAKVKNIKINCINYLQFQGFYRKSRF